MKEIYCNSMLNLYISDYPNTICQNRQHFEGRKLRIFITHAFLFSFPPEIFNEIHKMIDIVIPVYWRQ